MRLVWTLEAHADRKAIRAYIAEHAPIAALAFDELFAQKAARLIEQTGLGRRGRTPSTQELVMHKHYTLVYAVTANEVRILRVLHTSRQWPA